jgi:hypothetical protein
LALLLAPFLGGLGLQFGDFIAFAAFHPLFASLTRAVGTHRVFPRYFAFAKMTQEYSGKICGGAGLQQPTIREPFGTRLCRAGTPILISPRAQAYTRGYPLAV